MKTILYVEDDKINALVISKFLENEYHVLLARNQEEALQTIHSNTIDLYILDISLGNEDEDGVDLMNKIKVLPQEKGKNFIALTAHALKEDQEKYLQSGFDAYLSKPINRNLLLDTVARFL
ncbi:MAG: response regulator [Bacteroidetes bacterium]|nr:response regulator [Bacteroidota bacterium]